MRQQPFRGAGLIYQLPAEAVARRTALAETEPDKALLSGEHLGRELAAVLAGHRALNAFDDGGERVSIVLELLDAIMDFNAGATADVFVVGALVRILKPAPAADVINEDDREIRAPRQDVIDQLLERVAPLDTEAALALVRISADDRHAPRGRVGVNRVGLISRRILLVVG